MRVGSVAASKGYTVVSPPPSLPVGTLLSALPAGATVTYIGNTMYYVNDGVYYQPTMSNGRIMYVVANP